MVKGSDASRAKRSGHGFKLIVQLIELFPNAGERKEVSWLKLFCMGQLSSA